ncbi:multidrug and toxin extrusion protein 1-like isoform X2 [Ptychodera flava]|uniref:multidrug and toxin extrusion protein 1-like isoform X2 n=1 Tax=Ptychodera flava TaxID=63121 RepID=UPI003969E594
MTDSEETQGEDEKDQRRGCLLFGHSLTAVKQELWIQIKLAWPTILFTVAISTLTTVNVAFCGRLGKEELAAGSLGMSIYGTTNKKKVGEVLQRSLIIMIPTSILIWCIYLNVEAILIGLQIDNKIARYTTTYVHAYMLAVPGFAGFTVVSKYLQNQSIVISVMLFSIAASLISVPIHYVFLFVWDMQLVGAALALSLVWWLLFISLVIYIRMRNLHEETWGGWSTACLQDWDTLFKLAVAGILVMALEWWAWEIGTFFMGTIGEVELAAQGSLFQLAFVLFMLPFGYYLVVSIRVGNSLGAYKPDQAKLAAIVALISMCVIEIIVAAILLITKDVLGNIFTADEDVLAIFGKIVPFVALYQLLDAVGEAGIGILQGCGLQKVGAMVNFITYYIITVPTMFALVLAADMSVLGVWVSLNAAMAFKAAVLLVVVIRLKWENQAEKVQKRAGFNAMRTDSLGVSRTVQDDGHMEQLEMDNDVRATCEKTSSHSQTGPLSDVDMALIISRNTAIHVVDDPDEKHNKNNSYHMSSTLTKTNPSHSESNSIEDNDSDRVPLDVIICRRLYSLLVVSVIFAASILIYIFVEIPTLPDDVDDCLQTNSSFASLSNMTVCNTTVM